MHTAVVLEFLNMGGGEVMLIMAVILLLFGGKKLPELARGLGKGIRDFKDASEGVKREIHRNINAVEDDLNTETVRPAETAKSPTEDLEEKLYSKTETAPVTPPAGTAPIATSAPVSETPAVEVPHKTTEIDLNKI